MLTRFLLVFALATLTGCASVDFDYPKSESVAFADTGQTYLGKKLEGVADEHPPGDSGFLPLADGIDALTARLVMARLAERSIDAQYYLIKEGTTGTSFLAVLLDAADRGVRVRLLIDDMFTGGRDDIMAALDSHPNFEIRVFNPFASRSARFWDGITSFSRVNRRMHNKSFTVDNQVTLIGGRNIADEYFGARKDARFGDLDVLAIGPVVQDVSDMFDDYWNHDRSAPVASFANMPDDPAAELDRVRDNTQQHAKEIKQSRYAEAINARVLKSIEYDHSVFIWAPYTLAVDSPDKGVKSRAKDAASITTDLTQSLSAAENEVIIVSPYFVPRKTGVKALSELQARGVDVTVITNSLASNNQPSVHAGYAPSRKPLLQNGIRLYEVRADARVLGDEIVSDTDAKTTLHTKAFVVDRQESFIGSFNFDPRSANINTELGVIIRSPELTDWLADNLEERLKTKTFEVFLNQKGKLRWRTYDDGQEVILDKEPQTTWSQRFKAGFMRILPIRGQL